MKLFYYDLTGSHTSLVAANIHLKRLPYEKVPLNTEIQRIPTFALNNPENYGLPSLIGKDEHGNEIYTIGLGKSPELALQVIYYLLKDYALNDWRFYNTESGLNLLMKISGFFTSILKMQYLARYLAAWGIHRKYREIVKVVQKVREWTD